MDGLKNGAQQVSKGGSTGGSSAGRVHVLGRVLGRVLRVSVPKCGCMCASGVKLVLGQIALGQFQFAHAQDRQRCSALPSKLGSQVD